MKKYNSGENNPGYALFFFGWFFVMAIGLIILQKIPSDYQPGFIFGGSLICFGMSFFKTKRSHKAINNLKIRSNWLGFAGMVLTVLLLTVLAPNSSLAIWGKISTIFLD